MQNKRIIISISSLKTKYLSSIQIRILETQVNLFSQSAFYRFFPAQVVSVDYQYEFNNQFLNRKQEELKTECPVISVYSHRESPI